MTMVPTPEIKPPMNLWQKIHAVMSDVGYLQKDDDVEVGYNRSYRAITEEKVTLSVRAAMVKHGLVILPVRIDMSRDDLTVQTKNGERLERLTTVQTAYKIVDIETGDHELIVSAGTGADTQDKGIGKALTYAFKYALLRAFAIPTGDDPDQVASDPDLSVARHAPEHLTPAQIRELQELAIEKHGKDAKECLQNLLVEFGADKMADLTSDEHPDHKYFVRSWSAA